MFDSLSDRLQEVFRSLRGEARLTEADRRGRAARDPAGAARSRRQLQGRQSVHRSRPRPRRRSGGLEEPDACAAGRADRPRRDARALRRHARRTCRRPAARPRVILLLGLQGSGKTTTSGKLGRWLAKQGRHPLLVSTDVRRPAAIEQLNVVGKQAGVKVYDPAGEMDPVRRATGAMTEARNSGFDVVIVDTAGRLHIDDELMDELQAIKAAVAADGPALRG